MPEQKKRGWRFPDGFLWGSATSPTQVEGCTQNEWSGFVARDGGGPDDGCDAWENFEGDFGFMQAMGLNAFRIGLDWGRLQSGPGAELDAAAVERYRQMLDWLVRRDIVPFVTLFHFACPKWMADQGGWTNRRAPEWFADFARRVARLGLPARHWITVNEPGVYLTMAYLIGLFPPQRRLAFLRGWRALRHLIRGHHMARAALRSADPDARVGITKHFKYFMPYRRWHPIDRLNTWLCKTFFMRRILEAFLKDPAHADRDGRMEGCDFIGVNYYGRMRIKGFGDVSPVSGSPPGFFERANASCDDMWEQDPEWLARLLPSLTRRYGLPLFITESGFATRDESLRVRLFREHVEGMHEAIRLGADIRGYFYWCLTDNFEWAEGYSKKFGLAEVDFASQDRPRTLRPIARAYAAVVRESKGDAAAGE